jgi:hypothetical protein
MTRTAVVLALAVATLCSTPALAQTGGRVMGTVTDESNGVLPGVVVVVSAHDGRVLGTATTDSVGAYALDGLPIVPVRLTFQLEGFSTGSTEVALSPNGAVQVRQRLSLAAQTENVTVVGSAPLPPPPAPVVVPPPPPPVLAPIAEHARESVCGPTRMSTPTETFGTIRAKQLGSENGLYFAGDQLIVDRGSEDGLHVAQNFVARRAFKTSPGSAVPDAEHAAGLVQVIEALAHSAVVMVVYACDEVMRGDTLAAFKPERAVIGEPAGVPAYDDPARILFADQGQLVGVPRRLVVLDRGEDHGVRPGQRFTLFRPAKNGTGAPVVLGDALVITVRADSATVRIEHASDAITFTDLAAPQRYPATTPGRPR